MRFETPHVALAPIAGLQMAAGAMEAGGLVLVRCNRAEWETVERAYVFKDWHSRYYDANPVFLVRQYDPPFGADDFQPALDYLQAAGGRLVTALRLQKPGRVLEPAYTARFVVSDGLTMRQAGPYRTEYLAWPLDGLTWTIEPADIGDVTRLVMTVEAIESTRGTEALSATIQQFNLAHTPLVSKRLSVHLLLTALTMVFDDDRAPGSRSALTMYDRAMLILRWSSSAPLDPAIESFYGERVRPLRDLVHHHAVAGHDIDLEEAFEALTWSLRLGIRMLMQAYLGRSPQGGATPRQTLNDALNRFATGDASELHAIIEAAAAAAAG